MFYVLSFISGARKQITFTFVTWLIVKVYGQPVSIMALLFLIVSVCNIFFRPALGNLIDRKGERFILIGEGALMLILSFGFGFFARPVSKRQHGALHSLPLLCVRQSSAECVHGPVTYVFRTRRTRPTSPDAFNGDHHGSHHGGFADVRGRCPMEFLRLRSVFLFGAGYIACESGLRDARENPGP
jgi:predicted MFS family arabinose efflux permease